MDYTPVLDIKPSARELTRAELAARIQYTLVKPDATRDEIVTHAEICAAYGFNAAMVGMCWVPLAKDILRGTNVKVATCFGLGVGNDSLHAKVNMLRECWALGADEVDYEPNMGYFLSGMYDEFQDEAVELVKASEGKAVKAMLELGFIKQDTDQRLAVRLLDEAGLPWVKNSSGWGPGSTPATPENIRLIRETVKHAKVKASGKVNSYDAAIGVLDAGAELIGTSSAVHILNGLTDQNSTY